MPDEFIDLFRISQNGNCEPIKLLSDVPCVGKESSRTHLWVCTCKCFAIYVRMERAIGIIEHPSDDQPLPVVTSSLKATEYLLRRTLTAIKLLPKSIKVMRLLLFSLTVFHLNIAAK